MAQFAHHINAEPLTEIRPGLFGHVLEGEQMTLVQWEFPAGTPRTGLHSHDQHEQYSYVLSGSVDMEIDGKPIHLEAGEACRIPRKLEHGHTLVGPQGARILDVFSPPREDYVAAAHGAAPSDPTASQPTAQAQRSGR